MNKSDAMRKTFFAIKVSIYWQLKKKFNTKLQILKL